jgi:hypothetical protein
MVSVITLNLKQIFVRLVNEENSSASSIAKDFVVNEQTIKKGTR